MTHQTTIRIDSATCRLAGLGSAGDAADMVAERLFDEAGVRAKSDCFGSHMTLTISTDQLFDTATSLREMGLI